MSRDSPAANLTGERIARLHEEDLNVVFHLVLQNTQLFYGLSRAFRLERVLAGVCSHGAFSPLSSLACARSFRSYSLEITRN